MKKNNFKILITLLFFSSIGFSQGFQGKAIYQTKTTIEMELDSARFTPDQQKRIMERMKSMNEKVFELSFNPSQSIYKEEEKLEQPGQGRGFRFGGFTNGEKFKDTKSKTYTTEQEFSGKMFLIKDSLPPLKWEFADGSKMVGKHLCFKAIAKHKVPNVEQFRFGRGNNGGNENQEKKKDPYKEIEVVAWYTPDIPVNQGPAEYWGLPGLILEINADNTQMVCTKIVINPKDKVNIKEPSKGKVVTQEEYNEIFAEKMKEMREMFRSRGRDGGGRRGI